MSVEPGPPHPIASSPRRSRGRRRLRSRRLLLVPVVGLAAVGSVAALVAATGGEPEPCPDGVRTVLVAAAADIEPAITRVVRAQPEHECTTLDVVAAGPAAERPAGADVWIPESSLWLSAEDGTGTSIASSPVVLASPADADAAGPGEDDPLVDTQVLTADVRLALPDANGSAPAVAAVGSLLNSSRSDPQSRAGLLAAVRSSTPAASTSDVLSTLAPGQVVPTTEQAVWTHNTAAAGARLAAAYPAHGGFVLDYPFVVLSDAETGKAAADGLLTALQSDRGVAALATFGFRSPTGEFPAAIDRAGIDPTFRAGRQPVDAALAQQVADALALAARPSRMLAVIDVSGSMGEPVEPGGSLRRIDVVGQAAAGALAVVPAGTEIGLWEFSTRLAGSRDYRELVPVGELDTSLRGQPRDVRLAEALGQLEHIPGGATGLYDTTLAAVSAMRRDFDPDSVNSVVLLTDGRNDDAGSISLRRLLAELRAGARDGRVVPVIALAYGPDADVKALRQIASATGGTVYRAPRLRDIDDVFLDAVGQRLCRPDC